MPPLVTPSRRLRASGAGEAWMNAGATAANAFSSAVDQFERLKTDYPQARILPKGTLQLGRAKWLNGDAKGCGDLLRALFQERTKPGYGATVCYRAGVYAAQAYTSAGDTATAKSVLDAILPALASDLASLDDSNEQRFELNNIEADALLGEGFCMLADGKASQAKNFFPLQAERGQRVRSAPIWGAARTRRSHARQR